MTIEDFFKHLGLDIIFDVTCNNTEYKISIEILHISRYTSIANNYRLNLFFTSSQTNCGLLYFDGLNYIVDGAPYLDYLMSAKYYPKFKTLNIEDLQELGFLYTKYMLYKAWEKVCTTKKLVFIHTGYKDIYGDFNKAIYSNFLKLVENYYESPINKNSGKTQLHGVVDISKFANFDVPEKFINHFKDE